MIQALLTESHKLLHRLIDDCLVFQCLAELIFFKLLEQKVHDLN